MRPPTAREAHPLAQGSTLWAREESLSPLGCRKGRRLWHSGGCGTLAAAQINRSHRLAASEHPGRPHALLLYATELAKLHIAANRSLTSLHAHSCFALNARAPLPLFTPEADLLDHLGSYELLPPFSSSAVGVWLTGQPPVANAAGASDACALHDPTYTMRADPNAFRRLHQQAGLRYVEPSPEARRRGEPAQLHWFDRSGVSQGPSYQQQWHRVDAELRAHLEARHVQPPPGSGR
jgi:hypothetical protein